MEKDKIEVGVGEYIRTIDGYIRKVTVVNKRGTYDALCYGAYSVDIKYKNSVGISAKKVKAHSKNIIDLIEVGDYVNGQLIEKIYQKEKDKIFYEFLENKDGSYEVMEMIELKNIKSIVTKEQFKEMEYRV